MQTSFPPMRCLSFAAGLAVWRISNHLFGISALPVLLFSFWIPQLTARAEPNSGITALVGGTILDVSDFGTSTNDLEDSVVLVQAGRIAQVGPRTAVTVPADAKVLDVHGKFLIPGLIDGFATQNNQNYANAHLAMGVTSIVALPSDDERRGYLWRGKREPRVFPVQSVFGYDISKIDPAPEFDDVAEVRAKGRRLTAAELRSNLDVLAWHGCKVLLLMYPLDIDQTQVVVAHARKLGLATIGVLGHTSYIAAMKAGVQAFVHTTRIPAELAPTNLRRQIADHPFEPNPGYGEFLAKLDVGSASFLEYARALASGGAGLMPTLSIQYLWLPGHRNPWKEEVGPLIDPRDVFLPADRETGDPPLPSPSARPELIRARCQNLMRIQSGFARAGTHFLAASGTDVGGVLPGTGLHTEMELLVGIGLTPRQALASGSGNYRRLFGWKDLGELTAGSAADIVVLDADPTKDILNSRKIAKVVFRGEELDRKALLTSRLAE